MAVHHAGEKMIEWSLAEGGALGAFGVVIGALLGLPHETAVDPFQQASPFHEQEYHNAWTQGGLEHVFTVGLGVTALFGVGCALIGLGVRALRVTASRLG